MSAVTNKQHRILLVDDNAEIHKDFYKVLQADDEINSDEDEKILFNKTDSIEIGYQIDSAYQGREALTLVQKAVSSGQPYALAFIDIRMPPGWDGIETIKQIWKKGDPDIQVVICSAHSDHSWEEITEHLGNSDNLLILKKPFEAIEIRQLASALTKKWELRQEVKHQIENLQTLVKERTADLEESLSLTQATLESTQEGIVAINEDNTVITHNKIFLEIWNISEKSLKSQKLNALFEKMADQVEQSQVFLKMMQDLCKTPEKNSLREWKLKSGKILEIYTHPRYLSDKSAGSVVSFRDVTERKHLEEQLLHQATHDSLTGLPNRVLLIDRIQQAIVQAKRLKLYVGILFIDLDHFKQVNDSLGHKAGDILLKTAATKLSHSVRETDTVTRLGGDEFVVVLISQPKEETLISRVEDIRKIFLTPCEIEGSKLTVTASIGASIYPKDGEDPDTLLKNADTAAYRAKETRNAFQFYRAEFNERILQQAELTTALREALEKKEFVLYYQPLIKLNTSEIVGMEALLRWKHPSLGIVFPDTFIPLAEETGLIISIGEWVLKTACLQAKIWQKSISPELRIAVNVSVYQFRQENFVKIVQNVLKETGLNPEHLELEITESLILGNAGEVSQKMFELKELGIHLSMDDFGTGYASLSYLKCFPFDKVKIDKSFIEGVARNPEDKSIVEAIINMTNTIGLEVLAEGVEKQEQVDFLRTHFSGYNNQVQGYYFSPPLDEKGCTKLLKKQQK